ncbi:MAG: methyltransferase domain-containing protein [Anaerolineales bacterium]|jgi:ubiquinone/menaquinone biosynthesis C-methylase UbiE
MWSGIILILVGLAVLVSALALGRTHPPRSPALGGIENPDTAFAYDRISNWPQFSLLRRMVVARLARCKPAGTLADIGCGPGQLAILIAEQFGDLRVIGIDTAGEMVKAGTSKASALGLEGRLEFRRGEVERLPLPDSSLDLAISTLSLHHWSNPTGGLGEIYRVLGPGGRLLLFDLRRDSRRIFSWFLRFAQAIVVPRALRIANEPLGSLLASYTPAELQGLLRRSPFKEWRIEEGVGWLFVWATKG